MNYPLMSKKLELALGICLIVMQLKTEKPYNKN